MKDRPKKPKRRLAGITAVFSGGRWRWRAVLERKGRKFVGPLRDSQEQAAADRPEVELKAIRDPSQNSTLGTALDLVIAQAEARHLEKITLDAYGYARKVLEAYWPNRNQDLRSLNVDSVCWMAEDALEAGRSPLTVKRNYMGLLDQAFEAVGIPSPVPAAKKVLARKLRYNAPDMAWRPPEDVGNILEQVRAYKGKRKLPAQPMDIALMTVIAYTGVRNFEFSRVLRRDIDLDRGTMRVAKPKDRSNPRTVSLQGPALDAMRFVCEGLEPDAPVVPGGKPRRLNSMFEAWKPRLGIKDLNGRMLRHSVGAGMELLGAPDTINCLTLGHRPGSNASKRYRHAAEVHQAEHVKRLAAAIQSGQGLGTPQEQPGPPPGGSKSPSPTPSEPSETPDTGPSRGDG